MNRFSISHTPLKGLKEIQRRPLQDSRGFLSRLFCSEELALCGWHTAIAQINHTFTVRKGSIRGMHYQSPPYCEMKLVTCLKGKIWDVAVDIRSESPTFLQYHGVLLSAENNLSLLIPEGFAHGFQTLTDKVELLYCHSAAYNKNSEAGLNPLDPGLMIDWLVPVTEISDRDKAHPLISKDFKGITHELSSL